MMKFFQKKTIKNKKDLTHEIFLIDDIIIFSVPGATLNDVGTLEFGIANEFDYYILENNGEYSRVKKCNPEWVPCECDQMAVLKTFNTEDENINLTTGDKLFKLISSEKQQQAFSKRVINFAREKVATLQINNLHEDEFISYSELHLLRELYKQSYNELANQEKHDCLRGFYK